MKKILLFTLSLAFISYFNSAVFAQAPTTAASNVITVGKTTTSISINWTSGNGSKRIVTIALASSSVSLPVTGGTYTANSGFGAGSHLGNGNYCIYNGTSYGCNAFSLTPNTSYRIRVFEYNTVSTTEYYLTSGYPIYTEYTLDTEPVTAASSLSVSNIQTNSASLSFTSGSGTYDLVALRAASSYANVPVDATNYTAASAYGSGSSITGTSPYPYVLADGTSTFIGATSLSAGTTYTAAVFPFNGANTTINYKTTGYPVATFTTLAAQPTNAAYNMYFTNVTDNSMTVSWTIPSGGGSYHIVTCKPGTLNSNVPTDATVYTASSNFGSGSQIGGASGAYVVYNGMGNYVSVTGLTNSTDYTFSVYEYNVASNTYNLTYNYLTTSYLSGTGQTLLSEPTIAPSALTFSNIASNSAKASWANGNGNKRIVGVAAGRKPTALAFDGVNDIVSLPNESAFDFNTQMTVEAWIKVNSFSIFDQSVITKGNDSWMVTRNGSTNALKFTLTSNDFFWGTQVYSAVGTRSVNDGKWHHVAATYDGSQMILYIDGTLDAYTYMYNDIINNSSPVYIGGNAVASGNNFNGQIDEVRIWNIPQSYGNIRTNMNKTLIGNENGLMGYWKLDDGFTSTTTAVNSSFTSGLNATLVNFNSTATAANFTNTSGWIHSGATVNVPLDFSFYLDNTSFMSGTASNYYYGNLFYNVYKGPDSTSITVTGFSPNTYYTFEVFDYNGTTLTNNNYLTSNYAVAEVLTSPVTAPTLTSFTPTFGYVGSIVTINGTGFNTVASANTVYLGAAKATVLTANAGGTQLTVKVPFGASYERISVTNNMLTAYSTKPFIVTSPCGSVDFTTTTLDAGVSTAGYYPSEMRVVDMDSDGLPDVIGVYYYGYLTISRNTSTTTAVNLNNIYYITTGYVYSGDMEVGDLDGDGRTDIVLGNNYASGAGLVAVRNTSTPGSLNTPAILEFAGYPGVDVSDVAVADLDKDGKPDVIMSYTNNVVSYFRNTSSIGNISFAPRTDVALGAISVINSIAVGDIDGDGKMDIAAAGGSGSQINYLRNTSVAGTISFAAFSTTSLSGTITGIAIGDIDNDTRPEILYGNGTSNIGILKNNSTSGTITISSAPVFLTTLGNTPTDIKLGDIDGDGKLDIAVGYNGGSEISIYKNSSVASIIIDAGENFTLAGGGASPTSLAICDMNSDTKADVLSTTNGVNFSFFQNAINPLGAEPTVQATGLTFSSVSTSQITCDFTPGNGANKVIFVRAATSPAYAPTDGVGYVPNTTFGTGTNLGGGNYCVFDGNSNSVTVTGLLPNTSYVFSVYEYNGVQNCQFNYMPGTTSNSAAQMTLNNAPTLTAISNPSAVCENSGLQTVNLTGIGTGSANETQTLVITATSSNTGLIPNPTVVYSSPAATGSLTYTPVAGISGTAIITVTVNDGASNNNTIVRTFTVTVNHTPTTSVAGPNQQVCPSIATLAANTPAYGTGTWLINYTSNPAITITDVNDPTSTIYGFNIGDSVRLRWEISSGVCPVSGTFVTVKRKSCPTTADFTASSTVECLNGTPAVTFTDASISSGSTINAWSWSFGAGASPATANTQGPHTVLYSTAGPKHVSLTVTDLLAVNDNETKFSFVNITDVPDPATNISGSATVCQGQNSVNYTVPSILNATGYTWNLPSGAVLISGVNTNSIMVNFGGAAVSGNISVRGTNACGNGALSANFPVTVNPLPVSAGTITTTTSNICDGATGIVFSVPAITNATSYSWSLPGGVTIIGATNTSSITVNFTSGLTGGTISVNGVNSCGNGISSAINFVINPYPGIADAILGQSSITTCPSTSGVTYSIPLVNDAVSYNWTVPSGASIVSGAGTNSISVNYSALAVSGNVSVTPVNACGNGTASNLAVTVNTLPDLAGNISGNDTITLCPVSNSVNYSVSPVFNAAHYVWSIPSGATIVSGDSTNSIVVNYDNTSVSGSVSVYAENACGTGTSSSLGVFVTAVPMQELCMVSVDNNSNYNNVTWEKPVAMDIDSFRIYREVLSSFVYIASVHYDSLSSYVDSVFLPVADPNTTNFRYKISVIDTCGNESVLSNHHRTIFLQANQGVGGVVNLNWVPYEGATVDFYRILRDTLGSGPFVAIDSVPGSNTVFTDLNPPAGSTNIRYLLESNWSTSCTATRATVNTTRSNIKGVDFIITGEIEQSIMNATINVYPNPADEMITIEYPGGFKKYSLQLFDALGQMVINEELAGMVSANTVLSHQLDISALTKGVYIVNLQTEFGSTFKRIVIQ